MARGNGSQQPSGFPEDDLDGRCSEVQASPASRGRRDTYALLLAVLARPRPPSPCAWACAPSRAPGAFSRWGARTRALALCCHQLELTPVGHPRPASPWWGRAPPAHCSSSDLLSPSAARRSDALVLRQLFRRTHPPNLISACILP